MQLHPKQCCQMKLQSYHNSVLDSLSKSLSKTIEMYLLWGSFCVKRSTDNRANRDQPMDAGQGPGASERSTSCGSHSCSLSCFNEDLLEYSLTK